MDYKFWPAYLPEAGRPMEAYSNKMSDIQQKIDALLAQVSFLRREFSEIEAQAENVACSAWTSEEIHNAKQSSREEFDFE